MVCEKKVKVLTKKELWELMVKWSFFMHQGELEKAEQYLKEICEGTGVSYDVETDPLKDAEILSIDPKDIE